MRARRGRTINWNSRCLARDLCAAVAHVPRRQNRRDLLDRCVGDVVVVHVLGSCRAGEKASEWVATPARGKLRCGVHPQRFPPGGNRVVWSRNGRNRSNLLYTPRDSKTYRSGRREAHPVNQTGVLTGERESSRPSTSGFEWNRHGSARSPSHQSRNGEWRAPGGCGQLCAELGEKRDANGRTKGGVLQTNGRKRIRRK
jgi:hypothetical protein